MEAALKNRPLNLWQKVKAVLLLNSPVEFRRIDLIVLLLVKREQKMEDHTSDFELLNESADFNGSNGTSYSFNTTLDSGGGELSFENLYPVLLQTFVVIVLGYVYLRSIHILVSHLVIITVVFKTQVLER